MDSAVWHQWHQPEPHWKRGEYVDTLRDAIDKETDPEKRAVLERCLSRALDPSADNS